MVRAQVEKRENFNPPLGPEGGKKFDPRKIGEKGGCGEGLKKNFEKTP